MRYIYVPVLNKAREVSGSMTTLEFIMCVLVAFISLAIMKYIISDSFR